MRRAVAAERCRHARDPDAAHEPAEVEEIGLHDLQRIVGQGPAEVVGAGVLLAPGNRNGQRVGNRFRILEAIERHRLLEEGHVMGLEQPSDLDGLGHVIGAVAVGVQDEIVAEHLARERHDRVGARGQGIRVAAHTAADLELRGARARALEAGSHPGDALLSGPFAVVERLVHFDGLAHGAPQQLRGRPPRGAAEQIDHGKLHRCERQPEREALHLVVARMHVDAVEQTLPVAGVLADEEWRDALLQDGIERAHLQFVADREADGAAARPDADDVLVVSRLQHLDGLDDERVLQQGDVEDGARGCGVEGRIAVGRVRGRSRRGGGGRRQPREQARPWSRPWSSAGVGATSS